MAEADLLVDSLHVDLNAATEKSRSLQRGLGAAVDKNHRCQDKLSESRKLLQEVEQNIKALFDGKAAVKPRTSLIDRNGINKMKVAKSLSFREGHDVQEVAEVKNMDDDWGPDTSDSSDAEEARRKSEK